MIYNHYHVCLEWDSQSSSHLYPFNFNRAWLSDKYFSSLVTSSWLADSPLLSCDHMAILTYKLKRLKIAVKSWEKEQYFIRNRELIGIDLQIQALLSLQTFGILSISNSLQLSALKTKKDSLLAHEVLTWKLKSRVLWINEGDANTKFFHNFSSTRRNSKDI